MIPRIHNRECHGHGFDWSEVETETGHVQVVSIATNGGQNPSLWKRTGVFRPMVSLLELGIHQDITG